MPTTIFRDGVRGLLEEGAQLVDVLPSEEYGESHLPGLQALAGHATAAFTLQRYTHHYDASARRTADAMGHILSDEPSLP